MRRLIQLCNRTKDSSFKSEIKRLFRDAHFDTIINSLDNHVYQSIGVAPFSITIDGAHHGPPTHCDITVPNDDSTCETLNELFDSDKKLLSTLFNGDMFLTELDPEASVQFYNLHNDSPDLVVDYYPRPIPYRVKIRRVSKNERETCFRIEDWPYQSPKREYKTRCRIPASFFREKMQPKLMQQLFEFTDYSKLDCFMNIIQCISCDLAAGCVCKHLPCKCGSLECLIEMKRLCQNHRMNKDLQEAKGCVLYAMSFLTNTYLSELNEYRARSERPVDTFYLYHTKTAAL